MKSIAETDKNRSFSIQSRIWSLNWELIPRDHWLIGSKGVYHGTIGGSWTRIGAQEYGISSLIREPGRLVAGASWGSGLWEWPNDADQGDQGDQAGSSNRSDLADRWKQLHDETLTEIMAIASIEGSPGVVAGSPLRYCHRSL